MFAKIFIICGVDDVFFGDDVCLTWRVDVMEFCEYTLWELKSFRGVVYFFMLAIFSWQNGDDVFFFLQVHEP